MLSCARLHKLELSLLGLSLVGLVVFISDVGVFCCHPIFLWFFLLLVEGGRVYARLPVVSVVREGGRGYITRFRGIEATRGAD